MTAMYPTATVRADTARTAGAAPRLRLTRRGRAVFATLAALPVIVVVLVTAIGGSGAVATSDVSASTFSYVTVAAGQSLWELASEIAPESDPRDVISAIVRVNQLGGADVQPGQQLAIPAAYAR